MPRMISSGWGGGRGERRAGGGVSGGGRRLPACMPGVNSSGGGEGARAARYPSTYMCPPPHPLAQAFPPQALAATQSVSQSAAPPPWLRPPNGRFPVNISLR